MLTAALGRRAVAGRAITSTRQLVADPAITSRQLITSSRQLMAGRAITSTRQLMADPAITSSRQLISSSRQLMAGPAISSSRALTTGGGRPAAGSGEGEAVTRRDYRFIFPEFLPDPNPAFRNPVSERLQRRDMVARREVIEVPEFYIGTVMAVTTADQNSPHPNKLARFVGICIDRGGTSLRAWFILRNVVEGMGVEFMYHMYSPTVAKIEVLRLERRLDDMLYYLRDAPLEHSTVPFDLEPEILPEGAAVPLNPTVVTLNHRPWLRKWDVLQTHLEGYQLADGAFPTPGKVRRIQRQFAEGSVAWNQQTLEYDMMRDYRATIPAEEQAEIWEEVGERLEDRDKQMRKVAAKRAFVRPVKKL